MKVCVFCGSSIGADALYADAARELGTLLARQNISLVYGGGNVGLMGVVADAVMKAGGNVTGVIPDFLLKREVGHRGITRLEVVESMHERKKRMADLSDAFIALPGGLGTLEELCEVLTWKQLGLIQQPVALLNTNNFFSCLLDQMEHMIKEGFFRREHFNQLLVESNPEQLLQSISKP